MPASQHRACSHICAAWHPMAAAVAGAFDSTLDMSTSMTLAVLYLTPLYRSPSSSPRTLVTNRMCFTSYYLLFATACSWAIAHRLRLLPPAATAVVDSASLHPRLAASPRTHTQPQALSSCPPPASSPQCLALVFLLLFAHACRRLAECFCIHVWTMVQPSLPATSFVHVVNDTISLQRPANVPVLLGGCGFYVIQVRQCPRPTLRTPVLTPLFSPQILSYTLESRTPTMPLPSQLCADSYLTPPSLLSMHRPTFLHGSETRKHKRAGAACRRSVQVRCLFLPPHASPPTSAAS